MSARAIPKPLSCGSHRPFAWFAPVRVEAVELATLSEAELGRWRELAARSIVPNPFFEPDYVLPLAGALGQLTAVRLLVVRDDDWHAVLPVQVSARWRRVPLRSLGTWRGYYLYSPLGSPLVGPEQPERCLSLLLDGMRRLDSRAWFAAVELVAEDGEVAEPLAAAIAGLSPALIVFDRFERAAVRRRPEPTYAEETLSSSSFRELRRQRRKLAEALDGELEVVDGAGQDAAVERFVALETAGWKGREGTSIRADPRHVAFFGEMCRRFAELGRLQVLELRGPEGTAAMKCNLLAGDTIFLFKQAYDESLASTSPGMLLELEMLARFHDDARVSFIDSCANRNRWVAMA